MHIHVHRPVVCEICRAEMSEHPGPAGWFKCIICGAKRHQEER